MYIYNNNVFFITIINNCPLGVVRLRGIPFSFLHDPIVCVCICNQIPFMCVFVCHVAECYLMKIFLLKIQSIHSLFIHSFICHLNSIIYFYYSWITDYEIIYYQHLQLVFARCIWCFIFLHFIFIAFIGWTYDIM